MIRSAVFLFCFAAAQCAQPDASLLSTPGIGVARYSDGSVHPVLGVAGSFVVGGARLQGAAAASFSAAGGLVCLSGQVQLFDPGFNLLAQYEADTRGAVADIGTDLNSAVAWLPQSKSLLYWNGSSLEISPVALPDGSVVSISRDGVRAILLVANAAGVLRVKVSPLSGDVLDFQPVPGALGLTYQLPGSLLSTGQQGLQIVYPSGATESLPIQEKGLTIERMSAQWVHIFSPADGRNWVLHVTAEPELFELPAPRSGK